METRIPQCANCGAELDLLTLSCPYCNAEEPRAPQTPAVVAAPVPPPPPLAAPPALAAATPPEPTRPLPPAAAAITALPSPVVAEPMPATAASSVLTPEAAATASEPPAAPRAPAAPPELAGQLPLPAAAPSELAKTAPVVDPVRAEASSASAPRASEGARALGLALFEAEEELARGAADKALVLASRMVHQHPESLTARALLERARRELLKGRRRDRLEAKLVEAQALFDRGEDAAAERIVASALKVIPDHEVALRLFGELRQRRLDAGTVEAEAERELLALARRQARQALVGARQALAAGWGRKAVLQLRRGLRLVPDDPELLALLAETQRLVESWDLERVRRRALLAQVRAGKELLDQGRFPESLKILRALLREDPDNERAQVAVQQARMALLHRRATASRPTPRPSTVIVSTPDTPPVAPPPPLRQPPAVPLPVRPRPLSALAPPVSAVPAEILLPRTRRRATPMALVLGGGAILLAMVVTLGGRLVTAPGRDVASPPAPPQSIDVAPIAAASAVQELGPGPLADAEPALRFAIEALLQAYARALEAADGAALEAARPDLTAAARERRLEAFQGALNAATDIRVLDLVADGNQALVTILSTDVIVGGRREAGPPLEEKLRLVRSGGAWALAPGGNAGR
jgi:tetratricopeptide (TPR) repeat protein